MFIICLERMSTYRSSIGQGAEPTVTGIFGDGRGGLRVPTQLRDPGRSVYRKMI
jgi:hypothetical protein